ncbi:MAG: RluA family pseudouridine synthase [Oscillospiraceae bacterium]|nr:RluA family pseudouridine synthase [Oscillospiraceae bacterium]
MSGGVVPRVFEFLAERECTVEQLLKENGFSKGLIIELKKTEDGIVINGGRVRSTTVMQAGTRLVVTMPMPQVKRAKTELTVPIIYEDEDIILYDKPSGLACHRSGSHIDDTMENMMEGVFRPVTRLDRDTSGLLLAAKHQLAAGRLWQKTEKRYIAIAEGHFERIHGFIELPIMRIRPYDMRRIVDECGEPALTEYRVLAQGNGAALLECVLHTGRTHQIRVHLSTVGHPLFGDEFYGGRTDLIKRQALHCSKMQFDHPILCKKQLFYSEMPRDMQELLANFDLKLPNGYENAAF